MSTNSTAPPDCTASGRPFTVWRATTTSLLCGAAAAVVLGYALTKPLLDFQVYWTAPHLFVSGHNPYSFDDVFAMQRALGSNAPIPVMFLCPPWVLSFLAPLGFLHSYVLGWFLWFTILAASVAIGSKFLMDIYFGDLEIPEISTPRGYRYLFAFTFYPTLYALKCTQLSPLVFLGVAGFLRWHARERKIIAALFLCLTLLKPHLLVLLWLALLLQRQWKTLITSSLITAMLSGIAVLRFPGTFREYWNLMHGPYPRVIASGLFGGLRMLLDTPTSYWIQFVPIVIGAFWVILYWHHRTTWKWTDDLPVLVTASLLCTPYGFAHDLTLLMVPIIYISAKLARLAGRIPLKWVLFYTVVNFSVLAILFTSDQWAFVPAPIAVAIALWYTTKRANVCANGVYGSGTAGA